MAICRQACPYNTLDGCKVKEYGGVCLLTNTSQPITEYRMTNADRIRSMSDEELSEFLTHMNPTNCQDCAFSHGWRCQPDRDDYFSFEKCKEGRKRWLQQPAEEADNEAD